MALDSSSVKAEARRQGFDLVGICDAVSAPHLDEYREWLRKGHHGTMDYLVRHVSLKESPENLLSGSKSIVAVGLNYAQPNPVQEGHPRIATYALGRDYHRVMRGKMKRLASWIESHFAGITCRACVDSAPIFERDYAHLAGLGWFGKNTCLINSKRGSWFFIGRLLTTAHFEPDEPAVGGCGSCHKCIDACPTGAIVFEDGRWQVNARSCISYLTIEHRGPIEPHLADRIGDWTFGCDVCQDVCRFNEVRISQPLRAASTESSDFLIRRQWPPLEAVAQMQPEEWDALTAGSAIRRTGLEGMRRNATVNLSNKAREIQGPVEEDRMHCKVRGDPG